MPNVNKQVEISSVVTGSPSRSGDASATIEVIETVVIAPTVRSGTVLSIMELNHLLTGTAKHSWWLSHYIYRRRISIFAPADEDVEAGHPVVVNLPDSMIRNHKVRPDLEDIEVIHVDDAETNLLPRNVVQRDDDTLDVSFTLVDALGENEEAHGVYYIYYGNKSLIDKPERPEDIGELNNEWPAHILFNSPRVSYTRPGEHWQEGVSSQRNARMSVLLHAFRFRIVSEVGVDKGIIEVRIDGGDWEEVDLYTDTESVSPVYHAHNLPTGLHEITIRSTGRSQPAALGEEINVKRIEYFKSVVGLDMGEDVISLFWKTSAGLGN